MGILSRDASRDRIVPTDVDRVAYSFRQLRHLGRSLTTGGDRKVAAQY